jgi:ABC-type branched-subunit amino acid transport system substrate-binding protein
VQKVKAGKPVDGRRQTVNRRWQSHLLLHFAFPICLLPTAYCLLCLFTGLSFAQSPPYASINRDSVNYNGPGRESNHDLVGTETRIGLILPLTGPRQTQGEALQRAAQMAVDDENAASPTGHRLTLVTRDESGPWGQASTQIVKLVFDNEAIALITSGEGGTAHLAEQIGNKIGVPILTLSSDSTTTEINLPWIFRLGSTDAAQAHAFAVDIYEKRKFQRVLLLSQNDRDGGMGAEAFAKSAAGVQAPPPHRVAVDTEKVGEAVAAEDVATAQAVVIWADAPTAKIAVASVRSTDPAIPIYLCRKAAEGDSNPAGPQSTSASHQPNADEWVAAAPQNVQARKTFFQRYSQRFGTQPGIGAAEAYDAVRILAASLRQSGANRTRLRDALAAVTKYAGASGIISFDHAGNNTSQVTLQRLK